MQYSIILTSQLEGAKRLDAEYYQPEYLELLKNLLEAGSLKLWRDIEGKFITGPFGSEFNTENYVCNGEHRYVRGKDVKDFFLTEDDNVYVPEKDFNRLKKYSLNIGDILISVVGTPGTAAIVDSSVPPAIFSCKSTVYRVGAINPFYFIAYLNCKYGRKLLERSIRGALQTGLNIEDLRALPVYVPDKSRQERVADIVTNAKGAYGESKSLYSKAEQLLLKELGLENFDEDGETWSVVQLSEVRVAHRMDADYFQSKYEKLEEKLKKCGAKALADTVQNVAATFVPQTDKTYRYIELSNINSSIGVIDGCIEVSGKEAPSRARRILKAGDVIVSSVQGSLGKVALVGKEHASDIASTGFFQFRSKDMLPEVLLVLAKSTVMQFQMEQRCAGTILTAVPKESIKDILVPILPEKIQLKIADFVRESHAARAKASALLEKAKRTVEEWVERGTT